MQINQPNADTIYLFIIILFIYAVINLVKKCLASK